MQYFSLKHKIHISTIDSPIFLPLPEAWQWGGSSALRICSRPPTSGSSPSETSSAPSSLWCPAHNTQIWYRYFHQRRGKGHFNCIFFQWLWVRYTYFMSIPDLFLFLYFLFLITEFFTAYGTISSSTFCPLSQTIAFFGKTYNININIRFQCLTALASYDRITSYSEPRM